MDRPSQAYFAEREGLSFELELAGQEIEITLIEVKSLGAPSAAPSWDQAKSPPQRDAFSVVFRGPLDTPLDQGMFTLRQAGADELAPIFLVPIAADEQGRYYEAIFN